MERLKYGDINSIDYHVYVLNCTDEESTARDMETISVAGRTGDLHFDNGRYFNVTRTYQCYARDDAKRIIPAFIAGLLSVQGDQRIEDTLNPDYYKVGVFQGNVQPRFSRFKTGGRFDLEFDCKPQKFLKIGEKEVQLPSSNTVLKLYNPTLYASSPRVRVLDGKYGRITIGDKTIAVLTHPSGEDMIIDFETGDAYSATSHSNWNQYIDMLGNADFPKLEAGVNNISVTGTMASGQTYITPRWWTL